VSRFGSEFRVLLDADITSIAEVSPKAIAKAIDDMRSQQIRIEPGYDGLYGTVFLSNSMKNSKNMELKEGLWRFM
jgi:PHP family Zn ribbon phosphoesterase